MSVSLWWSWALAAIGCVGIYLAGNQNKWGWFLGVCAQVLWMGYAISTAQYGFCVTAVVYGFLQGKNFLQWGKLENTTMMKGVPSASEEETDSGKILAES